ncbi:MAG: 6,7-dimethyl-8-ribityllumazine synthase [Myxococcales bacterium]|nr:6,7-dimethyl-8-ribityllumazine synthase [Myxococcales bacterium]
MGQQTSIKRVEGTFDVAPRSRFAIVASRFNQEVVERLLEGSIDALIRHGVDRTHVTVLSVPGAWEIPFGCEHVARRKNISGIVAVGAVIRGETSHFERVAAESISGCARVMGKHGVPIGLGILTTESLAQAMARAGGSMGNKGWEAALSALEMASLAARLAGSNT